MRHVVITTHQRDVIFDAVREMYTAVARDPERGYHVPTGRAACEFVRYPADRLDAIPATIVVASLPSDSCQSQPELWAECIVGATTEADCIGGFEGAGFRDVEVLDRLDAPNAPRTSMP